MKIFLFLFLDDNSSFTKWKENSWEWKWYSTWKNKTSSFKYRKKRKTW